MTASPDLSLLAELRAAGLHLAPLPGGQVNVSPAKCITPEIRARIVRRKPELLAALALEAELIERVRDMAARWKYTEEELGEALALAYADPAGWLRSVMADEQHEARAARNGCAWPPASFAVPAAVGAGA